MQKGIQRLGVLSPFEVLPYIMVDPSRADCAAGRATLLGHAINLRSIRLQCFKEKGLKCARCGIEGCMFAVERFFATAHPHVNLYAMKNGEEVLMTHDHIRPRALGGPNTLDNAQTLCQPCNTSKGANYPLELSSKSGASLKSVTPCCRLEIQMAGVEHASRPLREMVKAVCHIVGGRKNCIHATAFANMAHVTIIDEGEKGLPDAAQIKGLRNAQYVGAVSGLLEVYGKAKPLFERPEKPLQQDGKQKGRRERERESKWLWDWMTETNPGLGDSPIRMIATGHAQKVLDFIASTDPGQPDGGAGVAVAPATLIDFPPKNSEKSLAPESGAAINADVGTERPDDREGRGEAESVVPQNRRPSQPEGDGGQSEAAGETEEGAQGTAKARDPRD